MMWRRNTRANIVALALVSLACVPASHETRGRASSARSPAVEDADLDRVDDAVLRARVRRMLAADPLTRAAELEVACIASVVLLTGRVDTLLERERAAVLSKSVRGVRSVSNRLTVRPKTVPDTELRSATVKALDASGVAERLDHQVIRNVVTLRGWVDSDGERDRVRRSLQSIPGVRSVVMAVDVETQRPRTDDAIHREVEDALAWNPRVDARNVVVSVHEGRVTLRGLVSDGGAARAAERQAWVRGVQHIDAADLRVDADAASPVTWDPAFITLPDAVIEEGIRRALTLDPRVLASNLRIQSIGGVVTLRGMVDTATSEGAAKSIALDTPGVTRVVDEVVVRSNAPGIDDVLAMRIQEALRADPVVHGELIDVDVDLGRASLRGTVETAAEASRAARIVLETDGIVDVDNKLSARAPADTPRFSTHAWTTVYQPYAIPVGLDVEAPASPGHTSDQDLEDSIRRQFYWSPFVDSASIRISVVEGRVTLTGAVEDWRQRHYAIENAYDGGATIVVDRLSIRG